MITIKDNHKLQLSLLYTQNSKVVEDFCKLAQEYIIKGPNLKLYQSAAQKLTADPESVQNSVEALVNLLIECSKHQVDEANFRDTVLSIGFNEDHYIVLQEFYNSQQATLSKALAERTVDIPQFKDLEWRLEAQVASRALVEQVTPQVMMKLSLESSSGVENILLQSDIVNLTHLTNTLEDALQEAKSQPFRRIQRRFK